METNTQKGWEEIRSKVVDFLTYQAPDFDIYWLDGKEPWNASNNGDFVEKMTDLIHSIERAAEERTVREIYSAATIYSDGSHTLLSGYLEGKYPDLFKEINIFPPPSV